MKTFAFVCLAFIFQMNALADPKLNIDKQLGAVSLMRVMFQGFDEVINPVTKQKELLAKVSSVDLLIPKQPLVLRQGDIVAGYKIGKFTKRGLKTLPNDQEGGEPSSIEIIHDETHEVHVLQENRLYTVDRDR